MDDKTKVLAREPAISWREQIVHLVRMMDGKQVAYCSKAGHPFEGKKLLDATWIVRDRQPSDSLCAHCETKRDAVEPAVTPETLPTPREIEAERAAERLANWLDTREK